MRIFTLPACIVLTILMASCNSTERKEEGTMANTPEDLFQVSEEITSFEMRLSEEVFGSTSLLVYKNYLLISDSDEEYLYKIADVKGDTILAGIIKKGNGPCEFQLPTSIQVIDSEKNLLGLVNKRTFTFYWAHMEDESFEISCLDNSSRQNFNFQDFRLLSPVDSLFIGYGLFENRFLVFDKRAQIRYLFSDYPFRKEFSEVHHNYLAMAFQGGMVVHPSSLKFAFFTRNSANIDFFTLTKDSVILKKEYKFWPPKFTFEKDNPQMISVDFEKDNEVCFISTTSNSNHIFTLYSGKSGKDAYQGNRVFVFDWEGLPVKSLKLDQDVKYIAVDETGDFLYAYAENEKPQILRFRLK
jgi:hypothetical protein